MEKGERNLQLFLSFAVFFFAVSFVSAEAIREDLHLNIQTTNSTGGVITGTYDFEFNISTTSACDNVVYTNFTTLTTDSRGIISYYLENVALNFSEQYWLCYYRNDVLINATKVARTPYTYMARNVSAEGIINNSNIDLTGHNVTASSGLFSWLGSLVSRITSLFVQDIDFTGKINGSGNINTTGNMTANYYFGNGSQLTDINASHLSDYNASYFMPNNKSVRGDFDFNGGWLNGGISLTGGNIFAQILYVYNLSSLQITSLNVNGSTHPAFDDTFDLGNSTNRWRDLWVSRNAYFNSSAYFNASVGIGTISPKYQLHMRKDNGTWAWAGIGMSSVTNQTDLSLYNVIGGRGGKGLEIEGTEASDGYASAILGLYSNGTITFKTGDGSSSPTEKFFITQAGNVGIGTTNPTSKLTVAGSNGEVAIQMKYSSSYGNTSLNSYFDSVTSANNYLSFRINQADETSLEAVRIMGDGKVGIGTTSPDQKLNIDGHLLIEDNVATNNGVNNGIYFTTDNPAGNASILTYRGAASTSIGLMINTSNAGTQTNAMAILPTGYIGMGTAAPMYLLEIAKSAAAMNVSGMLYVNSSSIGINATHPAYTLDVNGVYRMRDTPTTGAGGWYDNDTNNPAAFLGMETGRVMNNTFRLYSAASGTNLWAVNLSSGYMGIGTSSPNATLTVNGNLTAQNITASQIGIGSSGTGTINPEAKLHVSNNYVTPTSGIDASTIAIFSNNNIANGVAGLSILARSSGTSNINFGNQVSETAGRIIYGGSANATYTDAMAFFTATAERMRIDSSGNVGIGTTSPVGLLDLYRTSATNELTLSTNFANGNNISLNPFITGVDNGGFEIRNTTTNLFTISSTGNVGIGTKSPASKLEINTALGNGGVGALRLNSTSTANENLIRFDKGGTNVWVVGQENTGAGGVGNGNDFVFYSDSFGYVMAMNGTSGNVGIGTTAPSANLEVASSGALSAGVTINASAGTGQAELNLVAGNGATSRATRIDFLNIPASATVPRWTILNDYNQNGGNEFNIINGTPASRVFTILQGGNVGIGTTNPTTNLQIGDAATLGQRTLRVTDSGTGIGLKGGATTSIIHSIGTSFDLELQAGNLNDADYIFSSTGNVGIGTTSPNAKLTVDGSSLFIPDQSGNIEGRHYTDLASYITTTSSVLGAMQITLPKNWSNTLLVIKISGYTYGSAMGQWEAIVSGYHYAATPTWINYKAETRGRIPFNQIRLGGNGSNGIILLGKTDTVWSYPNLYVTDLYTGYGATTGWGSNWSITNITDESGVSFIVTPTIDIYTDVNGWTGIGTMIPTSVLEVNSSAANALRIVRQAAGISSIEFNNTKGEFNIGVDNSGNFAIRNADDISTLPNLNINQSTGYVGLGTAAPGAKLHIEDSNWYQLFVNGTHAQRSGAVQIFNDVGNWTAIGTYSSAFATSTVQNNSYIATQNVGQDLLFGYANFVEQMRLDTSTGNLGIGTTATSPSNNINVQDSDTSQMGIDLNNTSNTPTKTFRLQVTGSGVATRAGNFEIWELGGTNANRFTIQNVTGNIGIGTTTPTHLLNVFGNVNISGNLYVGNGSTAELIVGENNVTILI